MRAARHQNGDAAGRRRDQSAGRPHPSIVLPGGLAELASILAATRPTLLRQVRPQTAWIANRSLGTTRSSSKCAKSRADVGELFFRPAAENRDPPAGLRRRATGSASISSACAREVTPSKRNSSCSAARTQWAWLSIRPGMTVRRSRSITRVCGPLSFSMSALVLSVATMRPPRIASASAMVKRSSTVTILPLTSTVSGACATAGTDANASRQANRTRFRSEPISSSSFSFGVLPVILIPASLMSGPPFGHLVLDELGQLPRRAEYAAG